MMKFVAVARDLRRAVKAAAKVRGRFASMPALRGVLLKARSGSLSVSATDLEVYAIRFFHGKTESEGSVLVNPKRLLDGVGGGRGEVSVEELMPDILAVARDRSRTGVDCLDGDDFPAPPPMGGMGMPPAVIDAKALLDAVDRTAWCVGKQTSAFDLGGMCVSTTRGEFRLVSSNSDVMSVAALGADPGWGERHVLVSPKAFSALKELGGGLSGRVSLTPRGDYLLIGDMGMRIAARIWTGRFPDWKALVPAGEPVAAASLVRMNLLGVLRILEGSKHESERPVWLDWDGTATLRTKAPGAGDWVEMTIHDVALSGTVPPRTLGFKFRDLLGAANAAKGESLTVEWRGEKIPAVVQDRTPDSFFVISTFSKEEI
jgi:DNA polymerase III sliding clamp (beta) subunit (PCNA family)